MHHAAAGDLQPAGVLADAAARAVAEHARHVHFRRRLGEGEIRGPQAHPEVLLEEALDKKACSIAFKLAKLTFSPTTMPSTWWNIGVCVMSESQRYTRPGAMIASGGSCARMARICTGEVCVRSSRPSGK